MVAHHSAEEAKAAKQKNGDALLVYVPRETKEGECRVAVTPSTIRMLLKLKIHVFVEEGAGARAFIDDRFFREAGASMLADAQKGLQEADIILKIHPPTPSELSLMQKGCVCISMLLPHEHLALVKQAAEGDITLFSLNLIPRISRAQCLDALSSQSTVAGYKAVLLAANCSSKMFPLLMTAAGTVQPAKVVVMGAGVAGLQAIATARRLGAVVEASDVRLAAKEQVESLGAKFIEVPQDKTMEDKGGYAKEASKEFLEKQQAEIAKRVAVADVVITTALVPGKKAPLLITQAMVESMRPGSVIVDMAVEQGGNCAISKQGEVVVHQGVTIIGYGNLPAMVPQHATELFAKNIALFLEGMIKDGALAIPHADEVYKESLVVHEGNVMHTPTKQLLTQQGDVV